MPMFGNLPIPNEIDLHVTGGPSDEVVTLTGGLSSGSEQVSYSGSGAAGSFNIRDYGMHGSYDWGLTLDNNRVGTGNQGWDSSNPADILGTYNYDEFNANTGLSFEAKLGDNGYDPTDTNGAVSHTKSTHNGHEVYYGDEFDPTRIMGTWINDQLDGTGSLATYSFLINLGYAPHRFDPISDGPGNPHYSEHFKTNCSFDVGDPVKLVLQSGGYGPDTTVSAVNGDESTCTYDLADGTTGIAGADLVSA